MILVGRYISPFVRRVGASLKLLGLPFEHRQLSTTGDRESIREFNPLCRVPALILDDGETLIDSAAILDHLDERVGPDKALVPPRGAERRRVLQLVACGLGAAEKAVAAYYELTRRPTEKIHQPWLDQCTEQVLAGLAVLDAAAGEGWLAGGRMTQADVTAVAAVGFVRKGLPEVLPPDRLPRLDALVERAEALPAFAETRP